MRFCILDHRHHDRLKRSNSTATSTTSSSTATSTSTLKKSASTTHIDSKKPQPLSSLLTYRLPPFYLICEDYERIMQQHPHDEAFGLAA